MAAPTATTAVSTSGHSYHILWDALWTDTTNMTDTVVVDLSALAFTNKIKVQKVVINASDGIDVKLEFDATTDQPIATHPLTAAGPITYDFRDTPQGGLVKTAAGATGDIVITTLSAAANDRVTLEILGRMT